MIRSCFCASTPFTIFRIIRLGDLEVAEDGSCQAYRFINGLSLNGSHPALMLNYLEYLEIGKNDKGGTEGSQHLFSWAISLEVMIATPAINPLPPPATSP